MRSFTDWAAKCCAFLERGHPVVDALRYLGDELDHKPDELEYFPEGFKNDYLNADVLFNRLDVKNGRFVLPNGMSYSVIWVPDSVMLLPATKRRLDELSAKGGRIHFGSADGAVSGLSPQIAFQAKEGKSGVAATLVRVSENPYRFTTGVVAIEEIANKEKVFPCEWINEEGTGLTKEYIRYALPLIQGELTPIYENGLPKHISPLK